jgi:hypothetical protein
MAFVGERLDVGLDWFRPDRSASRVGSTGLGFGSVDGTAEGNESENFFIPEFGYNTMLRPDLSFRDPHDVGGRARHRVRLEVLAARELEEVLVGQEGVLGRVRVAGPGELGLDALR